MYQPFAIWSPDGTRLAVVDWTFGDDPTPATDVFALGICLYEITTGKRPFATGSRDATIERLLAGDFARPSELVDGYPPRLEQIVLQAMAHNTTHRYASAERMRSALKEYLKLSGPVLTDSDVAAVVVERVGHFMNERRAYIGRDSRPAPR